VNKNGLSLNLVHLTYLDKQNRLFKNGVSGIGRVCVARSSLQYSDSNDV